MNFTNLNDRLLTWLFIIEMKTYSLVPNTREVPNKWRGWADFFHLLHEKHWGMMEFFPIEKQGESRIIF